MFRRHSPVRRKPMTQPKLLLVEWLDAATTTGWHSNPEDAKPAYVWTLGFYAGEDSQFLRIAQSRSGGDWANITTIPISLIQKKRRWKIKL